MLCPKSIAHDMIIILRQKIQAFGKSFQFYKSNSWPLIFLTLSSNGELIRVTLRGFTTASYVLKIVRYCGNNMSEVKTG